MQPEPLDATDLLRLEAILGGEAPPPWAGYDLKVDQEIHPPELSGFTLKRLSDTEEGAERYLLRCGPSHWKEVRKQWGFSNPEDAEDAQVQKAGVQESQPQDSRVHVVNAHGKIETVNMDIAYIRREFDSLREAWIFAENLSRHERKAGREIRDIPPNILNELLQVLDTLKKPPGGKPISLVTAVNREAERQSEENLPMQELLSRMGKHLYEPFCFKDKRGHRQVPLNIDNGNGNARYDIRTLFDLLKFCEINKIEEFSQKHAESFLLFMCSEHPDSCGLSTLVSRITGLSGLYKWAKEDGECFKKKNPVAKLLKRLAKKYKDELDGFEREPHTIEQIKRLIQVAWEIDRPMVFPIVWSLFNGFRRCENLRSQGRTFDRDEDNSLIVNMSKTVSKKGTGQHNFDMLEVAQAWQRLFPDVEPFAKNLPFNKRSYANRLTVIRKLAGWPKLGKDELRKEYAIYTLIIGHAHEERQRRLRHRPGSRTTVAFYGGMANRKWAREYERLTPLEVLGFQPEPFTIDDLKAKPSGWRARRFRAKEAKAKIDALAKAQSQKAA